MSIITTTNASTAVLTWNEQDIELRPEDHPVDEMIVNTAREWEQANDMLADAANALMVAAGHIKDAALAGRHGATAPTTDQVTTYRVRRDTLGESIHKLIWLRNRTL